MLPRIRSARILAVASVALCACRPIEGGGQPWRALAEGIRSKGDPESTAVLVLFDQDVADSLRSRLPRSLEVVPFRHPAVPRHDAFVPAQLGRMYREASAATGRYPEVWVVGRRPGSATARARGGSGAVARPPRRCEAPDRGGGRRGHGFSMTRGAATGIV